MITVKEYLKDVCTKVRANESVSYTELMMDNHKCIEYGGKQYYVPDSSYTLNKEDEIIYNFLIDNYLF